MKLSKQEVNKQISAATFLDTVDNRNKLRRLLMKLNTKEYYHERQRIITILAAKEKVKDEQ